jgi:hypothetical protein
MAAFRPQQGSLSLTHATSTAADPASKQQQQQQWAAASEAAVLAAAADEGPVTVDVLIGCVLATVDELPVWETTEVEQVGAWVLVHCPCAVLCAVLQHKEASTMQLVSWSRYASSIIAAPGRISEACKSIRRPCDTFHAGPQSSLVAQRYD